MSSWTHAVPSTACKAALAQNISTFLVALYTKAWAAEPPSAQELLETVLVMETAVGSLRKLESCVADEVYVRISNSVSGAIIEPLFGEMLVRELLDWAQLRKSEANNVRQRNPQGDLRKQRWSRASTLPG